MQHERFGTITDEDLQRALADNSLSESLVGGDARQAVQREIGIRASEDPATNDESLTRDDQVMRSIERNPERSEHRYRRGRVQKAEMNDVRRTLPTEEAVAERDEGDDAHEDLEEASEQVAANIEHEPLVGSQESPVSHP